LEQPFLVRLCFYQSSELELEILIILAFSMALKLGPVVAQIFLELELVELEGSMVLAVELEVELEVEHKQELVEHTQGLEHTLAFVKQLV
jgi:hypothetical protein